MIKIDFHVHTSQGDHSNIKIGRAARILKSKGFDGACFVDHDHIPQKVGVKDFVVMYGEEVSTKQGHLLGINIKEEIKPGLSDEITAKKIRDQDGLVVVPHAFDYLRLAINRGRLNPSIVHAVETMNGRMLWPWGNKWADEWADQHGLPKVGGSDAHFYPELGSTYTLVESEKSVESIISAVKGGRTKVFGKYRPPIIQHVKGGLLKAYNRLTKEKL